MGKKKKKHIATVGDDAPRYNAQLSDEVQINSTRRKNGNGYLICDNALLAKEGVLVYNPWEMPSDLVQQLDYPNKIRVYRSVDTLVEHIDDFQALPLTDGHHYEPITAKDRSLVVGMVVDSKKDGKGIRSRLTVIDNNAVFDIESGDKTELSLGYDTAMVIQSGVYDGQTYDVVQTKIQPNHVALTKTGRNGPECRIADSATCDCSECSNRKANAGAHSHKTKDNDVETVSVVLGDEVVEVADKHEKTVKAFVQQAKDATAKADRLEGENETLKSENARLTDELSDDKINARVADAARLRSRIVGKASAYSTSNFDSMNNRDIMLDALKAAGKTPDENRSDDYVTASFDALPEKQPAEKKTDNGQTFAKDSANEQEEDPVIKAQREFAERNRTRGRTA